MAEKTITRSNNLTDTRIFRFRHKPTGCTQKVKSDTQQKALTRIVSQFWTGTKRGDWKLVWEDSEERVYGETS